MRRVLVVDDMPEVRRRIASELQGLAAGVVEATDGVEALELLASVPADVVVSDVRMPRMDGLGLLRALRAPGTPVILHSGYADVERAVEGLRLGAVDFLAAPLDFARLRSRVSECLGRVEDANHCFVAASPELERIRALLPRLATETLSLLITGETGVGKEVIARAIHAAGPRASRPFVAINVCALAEGVLESELFGHERGAFTGAARDRRGRFEQADGGTLLLDEIGDASPRVQAELLRVIETGSFERVGGSQTVHADVRILAATNRDLPSEIAKGRFRQDLWYRLSALRIHVPPLRERPADVDALAARELAVLSRERKGTPFELDEAGYALLRSYLWPGNARELRLALRRMVVLAGERRLLDAADVEQALGLAACDQEPRLRFEEGERAQLQRTLESVRWNVSAAARRLGIGRGALRSRMKRVGLGE